MFFCGALLALSGHTCCCSVAFPLCLCELSQCEEVGGKFKKGRGMGEVSISHAVSLFVLRQMSSTFSHKKSKKKQEARS